MVSNVASKWVASHIQLSQFSHCSHSSLAIWETAGLLRSPVSFRQQTTANSIQKGIMAYWGKHVAQQVLKVYHSLLR